MDLGLYVGVRRVWVGLVRERGIICSDIDRGGVLRGSMRENIVGVRYRLSRRV